MSVDYFLMLRKQYTAIIEHLKEIISNYDNILLISNDEQMCVEEIEYIQCFKEEYEEKVKQTEYFINYINQSLFNCCKHTFIDDTIDIDEDTCQNITYCSVCEYTKPY